MIMKWKERAASVILLLVFGFAFIYSRKFPDIPKIIPTGITVLGMIFCAALFVRSFFMKYSDDGKKLDGEQKAAMVKVVLSSGMLIAYVFLIRMIGFYVTSFVFMNVFAYVVDTEKHKWWMYPVVALGMMAVIYGIFGAFLKVPLPTGILF